MVDVGLVLNILQAVSIVIGISMAIIEIRKIREDRHNQFAVEMLEFTRSQEFLEHWFFFMNMEFSNVEEWREKYGPVTNPEDAVHWYVIVNIIDTLGQRVLNGQIDFDTAILYLNPISIVFAWDRSNLIFKEWREMYNLPTIMVGFEFLVNEIKKKYPDMIPMRMPNP